MNMISEIKLIKCHFHPYRIVKSCSSVSFQFRQETEKSDKSDSNSEEDKTISGEIAARCGGFSSSRNAKNMVAGCGWNMNPYIITG